MLPGLLPYVRRHAWRWLLALASSASAVALGLAVPRLLGAAIDDLRAGHPPGARLYHYGALMLGTALGSALLYVAMRRFAAGASRRISYEVRRDVFHRLTLLDADYFHHARTGDLMNRLTGDLSAVQEMLGFGLVQAATTAFTLVMVLTMMFRLSTRLGLLVLSVFPIIITLLAVLLRVIARRYARAQEQQSAVAARAQDNFSSIRTVKGYAVEDREVRDYRALMDEYRGRVLALTRAEGPLWATVGFLMNVVFVGGMLLGARQLLRGGPDGSVGGLTLGGFVAFTTYLFQLSWPVLAVGITANSVQRGSVSWKRLREVLFATPAVGDGPETDASVTRVEGALRFEGVSFAREGRTLLDRVDLEVPKGQIVGITGRTGAGKSLLGALVGRLYDPSAGVVKIDGHDARAIPLAVLRRGLGMVPQEPFLFSDTLAENIGFGVPARTDGTEDAPLDPALIAWAAHVSGLDRDLSQFPEGYDTRVGERGVTLSGGQRQRAALARALARKPAILVLDDALSAVDTETEAAILAELEAALAHTTVLLISHRVSTLRRAHTIVVLDKGRVVERGAHDALVAQGGLYADLERRQRLASQLAGELAAADDEAPAPAPSQGARGAR